MDRVEKGGTGESVPRAIARRRCGAMERGAGNLGKGTRYPLRFEPSLTFWGVTAMTEAREDYRYAAFISHRHIEPDTSIAKRLHGALETYRTPKNLMRELGFPARIGKVFRDTEELPTSGDLSASIVEALRESRFLIVVCSPRTPLSLWVAREIELFQALGRGGRILTLLIEGEPAAAFPPLLCARRVNPITGREEDTEPLAADIRAATPKAALRKLNTEKLRLLAPILGCGLDDLRQREHERQLQRARRIAVAALAGIAVFAGLTWYSVWQRQRAEEATELAMMVVSHLTYGLPDRLRAVPGTLKIVQEIFEQNTALLRRIDELRGETAESEREKASNLQKQGDQRLSLGDLPGAAASYRAGLAIAEKLAAQDPAHADWRRVLSVSHDRIGDVLRAQGDLAGALASYQASLAIAEKLAAQDPANDGWQRGLSISHDNIGDVLSAQGDLAGALANFRASLAIREKLAAQDPANADWQRGLSTSHDNIGDVLSDQGDLAGALARYRASLAIRDKLAAQDPANAGWQRGLSVSHGKIGDVLIALGDLAGALASYQASYDLAEKLAEQDPSNAGWLRDLALSYTRIGDVLSKQGNLPGALAAYRASFFLDDKMAAQDPANAGWQRDLSVSHGKIGNVLRAQGDGTGALASYRASLAIDEKLVAQDPANAGWQSDLAFSHSKIGLLLLDMKRPAEALAEFRAGLALLDPLVALAPDQAQWRQALEGTKELISQLEAPRGKPIKRGMR